jgi:O-antigen ligase
MPTSDFAPSRKELWPAAIRMWGERPLVGVGPDGFRHRYGPYLGRLPFDARIHTNNLYLEVLVNLGLLGAMALGLVLAGLGATARRALAAGSDAELLALGLAVSLGTHLVHGLADYFWEFTGTLALFWLTAGVLAGLARGPAKDPRGRAPSGPPR